MPHAFRIFAGASLIALLLPACAANRPAPAAVSPDPGAEAPVVVSTWSADTLADLLVGEVAGQRDQLDAALAAYLRQARALRDPALAERATRIAWYAREPQQIRAATTLWAELAPDQPEAVANAVMGLIQAGDIEAAAPQLDKLLTSPTITPVRFNFVIQYARSATPETRARLARMLTELSARHPDNQRLLLARAALADLDGQHAEALQLVQRGRALDDDYPGVIEFEGRMLAATGATGAARRLLKSGRSKFPGDRDLRLTYLRVLLEENRIREARSELAELSRRWPDDGDIALSLALVEWEAGNPDGARALLTTLAESGYREDEAWTYAGRVALSQHQYADAAAYFQNVRGAQFLTAQIQVAYAWQKAGRFADARMLLVSLRQQTPEMATQLLIAESELLIRNQDLPAALILLGDAVGQHPDDHDLRYARAMVAERADRIDLVEADLRLIIAARPDNAMAINALGYTLADRTDRHAEARVLIEQALALAPDDPAVIDSMGWVLFRLGEHAAALPWLRRAWAQAQDAEIAAHLGEVLWTLGEQREARRIWQRALSLDPDNRVLKRTMERLLP